MNAPDRDGASAAPSAGLVDVLSQMAFVTMGGLTKLAADNGLSLTQLRVLAILRDRRLRMTDLVAYLGLEKSTLTGLISRAEAKGLVTRARHPDDKRAVEVMLSETGLALAEQLGRDLAYYLGPVVTSLDADEQDGLTGLLSKALAQ